MAAVSNGRVVDWSCIEYIVDLKIQNIPIIIILDFNSVLAAVSLLDCPVTALGVD